MKKISLITLVLIFFCFSLVFLLIYPEPSKEFVFFVDFFKVDSCLDKGNSWNYKNRKCDFNDKLENKTINTNNWKTYEDDLYDFKIKYPESWVDPQVQEIDIEDFPYQYQVKFGTEKTLNGNGNQGFFVFVSKKNAIDENICTRNCVCAQMEDNLNQEIYQDLSPSLNLFFESPVAEDYTTCYFYHFMGQYFEYKLIPVLSTDPNDLSSLLGINGLQEFELAKNTFIIDSETIQKKAIELEKERLVAIERARQARIAAAQAAERVRQASLKSCRHSNDKPSYSTTKKKHVDEDCCPDPDEWPDPKCRYSAKDYKIMLKR